MKCTRTGSSAPGYWWRLAPEQLAHWRLQWLQPLLCQAGAGSVGQEHRVSDLHLALESGAENRVVVERGSKDLAVVWAAQQDPHSCHEVLHHEEVAVVVEERCQHDQRRRLQVAGHGGEVHDADARRHLDDGLALHVRRRRQSCLQQAVLQSRPVNKRPAAAGLLNAARHVTSQSHRACETHRCSGQSSWRQGVSGQDQAYLDQRALKRLARGAH